jgi:hypothetical protein
MEKMNLKNIFLILFVVFMLMNILFGFDIISGVLALIFFTLWIYFLIKGSEKKSKKKLVGIGGWLILPTIILILSGIVCIFSLFLIPKIILNGTIQENIFLILFGIIGSILIPFTLFYEAKRKKLFPKLAISTLGILYILDAFYFYLETNYVTAISNILVILILTIYLLKSQRVKNTFKK